MRKKKYTISNILESGYYVERQRKKSNTRIFISFKFFERSKIISSYLKGSKSLILTLVECFWIRSRKISNTWHSTTEFYFENK
jgi:hypothetical protein